jgi:hypothetical protein
MAGQHLGHTGVRCASFAYRGEEFAATSTQQAMLELLERTARETLVPAAS